MTDPYAMPPGYDNWKLASPEDEDDVPPRRLQLSREPREYGSRMSNGRRIYEADFIYDPIGKDY